MLSVDKNEEIISFEPKKGKLKCISKNLDDIPALNINEFHLDTQLTFYVDKLNHLPYSCLNSGIPQQYPYGLITSNNNNNKSNNISIILNNNNYKNAIYNIVHDNNTIYNNLLNMKLNINKNKKIYTEIPTFNDNNNESNNIDIIRNGILNNSEDDIKQDINSISESNTFNESNIISDINIISDNSINQNDINESNINDDHVSKMKHSSSENSYFNIKQNKHNITHELNVKHKTGLKRVKSYNNLCALNPLHKQYGIIKPVEHLEHISHQY